MSNPLRFFALSFTVLLLFGCAQYPSGGGSNSSGAMLNVTMSVAGIINPNYYYFVVFNNTNDPHGSVGPTPVIAPPWGNGFVSGSATSYVEYSQNAIGGDGYLFYNFGSSIQQVGTPYAAPTQDTPVNAGGNTLQFRIPVSWLATSSISAANTNYIQVNMIATNRIPTNPQDTTPKEFDALGNTLPGSGQLNDYFTFPTAQSNSYSSTSVGDEPTGDAEITNGSGGYSPVNDPDVDISGWTMQVTH